MPPSATVSPTSCDPVGGSDEVTSLNYLQWQDEFLIQKPFEVLSEVPQGCPKTNFSLRRGQPQKIADIRAQGVSRFNLDDNGFQIYPNPLSMTSFGLGDIEQEYLPLVKGFLQTVDPGAEVFIFDWKLRSSEPQKWSLVPGANVDLNDPMLCLGPVQAVHVDQSPIGAVERVKHHMGDRAKGLLKKRFRIINVWRPIAHDVENYPLAVCDGSSVPAESLVEVDHVRKHYIGESLYVLESPSLRWYFLNRQTKDEVIVFKTFDSDESVKAKCEDCPSFTIAGLRLLELSGPLLG